MTAPMHIGPGQFAAKRVDRVRLIQVVEVEFISGEGTEADPVRMGRAYYAQSGELLAMHDTPNEVCDE